MASLNDLVSELIERIAKLERHQDRQDSMIMTHEGKFSQLCKDGVIWDTIKHEANQDKHRAVKRKAKSGTKKEVPKETGSSTAAI